MHCPAAYLSLRSYEFLVISGRTSSKESSTLDFLCSDRGFTANNGILFRKYYESTCASSIRPTWVGSNVLKRGQYFVLVLELMYVTSIVAIFTDSRIVVVVSIRLTVLQVPDRGQNLDVLGYPS